MRFGRDIVAARAVTIPDSYSFTTDRPWVNHEWLAEVLMAVSFNALGSAGLNLLRIAIVLGVVLLVWRRLTPTHPVRTRLPLVAAAVLGIAARVIPVRPQLFSVLLFAALLTLITDADEQSSDGFLLAPAIFVPWANLHGGWLVGLGTFWMWSAGRIIRAGAAGNRTAIVKTAIAAAAAGGATLVNPYGTGLWEFLRTTVSVNRPFVSDWQPLFSLPPAFWAGWLVTAALVVFAVLRARRLDLVYVTIVCALGCIALRVSRLDAFFSLAAMFLVVPAAAPATREARAPTRRSRIDVAIIGTCAAAALILGIRQLGRIEVRSPMAPEPAATRYVLANHLQGRMLTWFGWGEYAIWYLSPDIKVSIDGRRETAYSDDLVSEHIAFYGGAADAAQYPDRIGADYVWLPRVLAIVPILQASGWHAVFTGPESVILARATLPIETSRASTVTRAFPGP